MNIQNYAQQLVESLRQGGPVPGLASQPMKTEDAQEQARKLVLQMDRFCSSDNQAKDLDPQPGRIHKEGWMEERVVFQGTSQKGSYSQVLSGEGSFRSEALFEPGSIVSVGVGGETSVHISGTYIDRTNPEKSHSFELERPLGDFEWNMA